MPTPPHKPTQWAIEVKYDIARVDRSLFTLLTPESSAFAPQGSQEWKEGCMAVRAIMEHHIDQRDRYILGQSTYTMLAEFCSPLYRYKIIMGFLAGALETEPQVR